MVPFNLELLNIVDYFSEVANFFALLRLSSTSQTLPLVENHVFHLQGLPENVVSDRGFQFTSQVWRAFCNGLRATTSLPPGYHPHTDGQSERGNPEMEAAVRSVPSANTTSSQLL